MCLATVGAVLAADAGAASGALSVPQRRRGQPGEGRPDDRAVTAQGETAQDLACFWVLKPKKPAKPKG